MQSQKEERSVSNIFVLLLLVNLLNNFDTGVIPAALIQIQNELGLDYKLTGLIGSLDYLGVSLGSVSLPFIIRRWPIKWLLAVFLLVNSAMSVLIGLSYRVSLIYLARFVQGFTQSLITSYAPIWINEFAPAEHATLWLGLFGGLSSIGIMVGYTICALLLSLFDEWRACFFIQAAAQGFIAVAIVFISENRFNVWTHDRASVQEESPKPALECFLAVLRLPVFVTTTVILCILYFVVTAIQYWATSYAILYFHIPQEMANLAFSVCAISGPVAGVLFGGYVIDELGGYKGKEEREQAIKFIALFCLAGSSMGLGFGFAVVQLFMVVCLWFLLFFGGAMVPVCNGICVSSVRKDLQPYSSAVTQVMLNLVGYFLSPIITGAVMDLFSNKVDGLAWGLRTAIFLCAADLLVCLLNIKLSRDEVLDFQHQ